MEAPVFSLLLLFAACESQLVVDDTGSADADTDIDTDADTDTDTDTDADTDTATDTDTGGDTDVVLTTLTFDIEGDHDADWLQLQWLNEDNTDGGPLAGARITGNHATVELPAPALDDLNDVPTVPGLYYRYALPFLFVDTDGNEVHGAGEPIEAASEAWALYITGAIPVEYTAMGIVDGWNAIYVTGDTPVVYDTTAIPMPVNLLPRDSATLGGTNLADLGPDAALDLVLMPGAVFNGFSVDAYLYNEALGDTWTIDVSGAVPDDHVTDISGTGLYGSVEVPIAYTDANGDGMPAGTELLYPACAGTEVAALLYLEAPTDPLVAYYFVVGGVNVGWNPYHGVTGSDDIVMLSDEEATSLEIGGSCSFE
jgi:hypothetical protein